MSIKKSEEELKKIKEKNEGRYLLYLVDEAYEYGWNNAIKYMKHMNGKNVNTK